MKNLVLVVHLSLDGFVAGTTGELDGFEPAEENLEFVCSLTEHADAAMFGRKSFQLLHTYWPTAKDHPGATRGEVIFSDWYNKVQKIVFSKTLTNSAGERINIHREIVPEAINQLKQGAGKDILIFGSPSIAQVLMQFELIDSYWIFINPIIFGKGIPLFAGNTNKRKLKLAGITQFRNGEAAMHFLKK